MRMKGGYGQMPNQVMHRLVLRSVQPGLHAPALTKPQSGCSPKGQVYIVELKALGNALHGEVARGHISIAPIALRGCIDRVLCEGL